MITKKLQKDKILLKKQLYWLEISFDESAAIGLKNNFSLYR
jgi:hypothetical protein